MCLFIYVFVVCFLFFRPVREEPPEVLSTRSNVFDDDEFDVFQRDQVDMDRVWKGKKLVSPPSW